MANAQESTGKKAEELLVYDELQQGKSEVGYKIQLIFFVGLTGWCHFTAIIDSYDRHIVGWRFSEQGRS